MNDTKWNELRLAMDAIEPSPLWSTLVTNGCRAAKDRDWYYHFRNGGYEDIIPVDIFAEGAEHRERILAAIKQIHLPGEVTDDGFRIYGYAEPGQAIDYL
ncbi:DUF6678 family protein [Bradyrhizobium viridifuturi]|uniref:DUF6678 family protein n=1 Tax=Bradyrhizobium viridifuturi TaxID=1654716 RepID=UPI00067E8317|nr:DUF6678 family protein [Bradyrhizobium viridifuturi]